MLSPTNLGGRYRLDINGLRAVAVLLVVLYHIDIVPVPGGFIGVDVFYVISGYLITGIVNSDIDAGKFTFSEFYQRRIRRLFPALFAMLLTVTVLGFVVFLPTDLIELGKTLATTAVFSSNFYFWRSSGYFDGSSDSNPLLHTWSLAVEEQFYIVFPAFLLLARRYAANRVKELLALIAAATFGACIALQRDHPMATFYLAPFRAWELATGALLALGAFPIARTRWQREAIAAIGLVLIIAAAMWLRPGNTFPGWRAGIPVLGSAMVILAGTGGADTAVSALLRTPPLVALGLLSYSLYLWHWPIYVFWRYASASHLPSEEMKWGVLIASLAVATLSYVFVEQPFRRPRERRPFQLFAGAATLSCALMLVGIGVFRSGGAPSRFERSVVVMDRERTPNIPYLTCMNRLPSTNRAQGLCVLGALEVEPNVLVWGDSHSLAWSPVLDQILKEHHLAGILGAKSSCAPLLGVINPAEPDCLDHNETIFQYVLKTPTISTIILTASWANYANENEHFLLGDEFGHQGNPPIFSRSLRATVEKLAGAGKRVWILGSPSRPPGDAPLLLALALARDKPAPAPMPMDAYTRETLSFYQVAEAIADGHTVVISNPGEWMCRRKSGCQYQLSGLPLFRDDGHLNVRGALLLHDELSADFDRIQSGGQTRPPAVQTSPLSFTRFD